jgi:hypothetical protein
MTCENKDSILEIKSDIKDIKENLSEHMARTAANEARLELMEKYVMEQSKENQTLVKQMGQQLISQVDKQASQSNKQLKLTLGLFTALAVLIGALWKVSQ